MKKGLFCIILVIMLVVSVLPAGVFAAGASNGRSFQSEQNIASELKKLNLFKGVSDTEFDLERAPSRIEALVIMLRLLGKESEILAGSFKHPFTDVPSWADNYIGYAYEKGLTKGISANEFGVGNASDVQFLTFVLRAMEYSDSEGDFAWDNPYEFASKIGVLTDSVKKGSDFLRADCVTISYNALSGKLKNQNATLADKLVKDKVFTQDAYAKAIENVQKGPQTNPGTASKLSIPIGIPEVNEALLALNPDTVEMKGLVLDGSHYWVTWKDPNMWYKVVETMDDSVIGFSKDDWGTSGQPESWLGTRIEILFNYDGSIRYTTEMFTSDGMMTHIQYSDMFLAQHLKQLQGQSGQEALYGN